MSNPHVREDTEEREDTNCAFWPETQYCATVDPRGYSSFQRCGFDITLTSKKLASNQIVIGKRCLDESKAAGSMCLYKKYVKQIIFKNECSLHCPCVGSLLKKGGKKRLLTGPLILSKKTTGRSSGFVVRCMEFLGDEGGSVTVIICMVVVLHHAPVNK
jgi:hypothetical protein